MRKNEFSTAVETVGIQRYIDNIKSSNDINNCLEFVSSCFDFKLYLNDCNSLLLSLSKDDLTLLLKRMIIQFLLDYSSEHPDSCNRIKELILLLPDADANIYAIRQILVDNKKFLDICISWLVRNNSRTVFYEMELVQFLVSVVSIREPWSTKEYLNVSGMEMIKNDLLQQLEDKSIPVGNRSMLLRCLVSLCCIWNISFSSEEINQVLDHSQTDENILVFYTSFLILSTRMFKENEKHYYFLLCDHPCEFALSIGLYIFTNQIQEIQNLLSTTLQLPISLLSEKYQFIRHTVLEIFNNDLLAKSSLVLLREGEISEKHDLSINLACNLLQANLFDQVGGDFLEGITFVFEKAKYMNQTMRDLLHLYCKKSIESNSIKMIPVDYITRALSNPVSYHLSLLVYYVYLHRKFALSSPFSTKSTSYADELVEQFPVKKILNFIQTNLSFIFPEMVALISLQSPSYFHVTNKLLELTQKESLVKLDYVIDDLETFDDLKLVLKKNLDIGKASQYKKVLTLLPHEVLFTNFNSLMDLLVEHYCNEYRKVWISLYLNSPTLTCANTLNYFGIDGDFISNPLLIFDAFRGKNQLLSIFLQVLNHAGSEFRHKIRTGRTMFSNEKDSALLAYDSLVIQHLFNLIQIDKELVCKYIHQVFVDRPLCIRLVNFQGYDLDIIPIVVDLVPSMHVCVDYCSEITTTVNPRFGITLAAYLCRKYPLEKTLKLARSVIDILKTNVTTLIEGKVIAKKDTEKLIQFLVESLGLLTIITSTFVVLAEEVVQLLSTLGTSIYGKSEYVEVENVIYKVLTDIHKVIIK
ncbi:Integrator complex subunit 2 [Boothiomyces sp. JEL0866]|nr:Integrator complex subunit 2 [Boothiomyces sp. JEL0866]